uniref:Endoplasmic oxidoreductin putative n=1 Tax=Albugo laibachii Nc14 TaxID=890382 RepID=F0WUJ7_9STRA|nr:endoplasmic oxidoreductin putative [Albugo laibachii Nc14]|eukprot:CCA25078.1 endoplasmic oxidoreductin putative [Albugo laibachii Nc14]
MHFEMRILAITLLFACFDSALLNIATDVDEHNGISKYEYLFGIDMIDFLQYQVCHTPDLSGSVEDSGCNYETVDKAVSKHFHPLLEELSKLRFFRYFKVNLGKECPFWVDDGMCSSIDCAVCECPPHEIPHTWSEVEKTILATLKSKKDKKADGTTSEALGKPCSDQAGESALSRVNKHDALAGETYEEWEEGIKSEVWSDPEDDTNMVYINLLENPESYTGYSGYQATRIWDAIYKENCFVPSVGMCFEERVYYKLISGLQASINTHIALKYKYGESWGRNPSLYVERVGKHPERLHNLYFVHLFVMRALGRYRDELLQYDFSTGDEKEDNRVVEILRRVVLEEKETAACPVEGQSVLTGFDEQALFRVKRGNMTPEQYFLAQLEKRRIEVQFREKFRNVTRIMDCVSCEKCRLWGKLQILGLGTAIKILLAEDIKKLPKLQRNEIIALINVANKLAQSIEGVKVLRRLEFLDVIKKLAVIVGVTIAFIALISYYRRKPLKRSEKRKLVEKSQ